MFSKRSKMRYPEKRWQRLLLRSSALIISLALIMLLIFNWLTSVKIPEPPVCTVSGMNVRKSGPDFFSLGRNWLQKSNSGLWEMYVEGGAFERGVAHGKLARNLIAFQELAFIDRIREMIPGDNYLTFLKYFIYWFNRNLDQYITDEYKQEIYGVSLSASGAFSSIGPAYQRMLNYHSAHDIGHALQDLSMVGCTSLGIWGAKSKDSTLIIGRNFDFYSGDEFSRNKIVCFEKPDQGYGFMMITWGGMIGVVSGMNEKGLTVTINAAKSEIPWSARTPISILAREILQYSSNIGEAYEVAKKRETFVSESILIGSAADKKAAIIEKSPFRTVLFMPSSDQIVCANHFQSATFASDPLNILNKANSASVYRQTRLEQDLKETENADVTAIARILRDQAGLNGQNIGMGNEKAINQLIAHHSIIFMPEKRLAWVSTDPWQLGSYVCYDLSEIFFKFAALQHKVDITVPGQTIQPDPFLQSEEYYNFLRFRKMRHEIKRITDRGRPGLPAGSFLTDFKASNPRYYEVYELCGDYYLRIEDWFQAREEYRTALSMVIPRMEVKEIIIKKFAGCNFMLKQKQKSHEL